MDDGLRSCGAGSGAFELRIGVPAAKVAGLVARPLPFGELAQLGCDHGLHQHVPLRVESVPVVRGVNVLMDTAMLSYMHAYIHAVPRVQSILIVAGVDVMADTAV